MGSEQHSTQATLQERLSVLSNGRLQIYWQFDDPSNYSEPVTGSQILQATDKEIITYKCEPDV